METVFIGGVPRSGTTLLGSMLGAHSECICTPESAFKLDILGQSECQDDCDVEHCVPTLQRSFEFKLWGIPAENVLTKVRPCSPRSIVEALVGAYASSVGKPDAQIWVDHTPSNIQHVLVLHQHFPGSKFIHIIRDPRAVAASVIHLDWGPSTVLGAAQWWMKRMAQGLGAETSPVGARVLRVRYEDLVTDPERVLQGICDFIELNYEAGMVRGGGFHLNRYTAHQHALIQSPPTALRIDAWRGILSQRQVESIESLTGELLEHLGYKRAARGKIQPPKLIEMGRSSLREIVWAGSVNKIRKWLRRHRA